MKRKCFIIGLTIMVVSACQDSAKIEKPELEVKTITRQADSSYVVADLAIEGMMCAHACGGKIQQELRKIPGVKNTELDFIEERKVNIVHVQFDPSQVEEQKMIASVNAIVDGKYTVVSAQRNVFVQP
jgi:copper chaperone CopZ